MKTKRHNSEELSTIHDSQMKGVNHESKKKAHQEPLINREGVNVPQHYLQYLEYHGCE